MTIAQFLEELKKYKVKFKINKSGEIRDNFGYCPICSLVVAKEIDDQLSNIEARYYGINMLSLTDSDVTVIMNTADNLREQKAFDPELRKRLINDYT